MLNNETANSGANVQTISRFEHILFPRDPIHNDAGLLARFLTDLRYEEIPQDVLHTAKQITLDTIGCIVAGAASPLGQSIIAAYSSEGAGACSVAGTSLKLAPSLAAKVNAWLSDVLDYEDYASGHPSATVIPAALAMAEHLQATPKQFLAGVVAGYEAGLRVHDATRATPEAYRKFAVYHAWHGIAAGAAAMVVSGGSDEQFRSALGHAAANTNLPIWYVQYGRPSHALKANYGQMALGGVDAALCARKDILGPYAMLSDRERGFAQIIGSDQFDPTQLSAELMQKWRIKESSLKAYPCCAFLHTTIDAVAQIVSTHKIHHGDIVRVDIRCFSRITEWFTDRAPASPIDAQLSVEYVSAMTLLNIEPGRGWYEPELMESSTVSELMRKICVRLDPIAEAEFWRSRKYLSSATITVKDGQEFCANVEAPRGHWQKPFSDGEVAGKFIRNLRGTALDGRGEQIIQKVLKLNQLDSLKELSDLLIA